MFIRIFPNIAAKKTSSKTLTKKEHELEKRLQKVRSELIPILTAKIKAGLIA